MATLIRRLARLRPPGPHGIGQGTQLWRRVIEIVLFGHGTFGSGRFG